MKTQCAGLWASAEVQTRHHVFRDVTLRHFVNGSGSFETGYSSRNGGNPTASDAGSHPRKSDTSRCSVYSEVVNEYFKVMISVFGTIKIIILLIIHWKKYCLKNYHPILCNNSPVRTISMCLIWNTCSQMWVSFMSYISEASVPDD